jgi:hypothetical protein
VQAYSAMYADFAICLLNAAARILPRSVCTRLALVAFDMAQPIGGVVAAVYASVRDFGDLVRLDVTRILGARIGNAAARLGVARVDANRKSMSTPDYEAWLEDLRAKFKSLEDAIKPFMDHAESSATAGLTKFYEQLLNDPKTKELGAALENLAKHGVQTFEESLRPATEEVARQLKEWERRRSGG